MPVSRGQRSEVGLGIVCPPVPRPREGTFERILISHARQATMLTKLIQVGGIED